MLLLVTLIAKLIIMIVIRDDKCCCNLAIKPPYLREILTENSGVVS